MASLSSVERFNPHLNKWTEVSEMGQRRAGNGVSKLNGCLYVVGKTKKSNQIKMIISSVGIHNINRIDNGKFYIIGYQLIL